MRPYKTLGLFVLSFSFDSFISTGEKSIELCGMTCVFHLFPLYSIHITIIVVVVVTGKIYTEGEKGIHLWLILLRITHEGRHMKNKSHAGKTDSKGLPSGIETHEEEWDERRRFSYISQSFFHPLSLLSSKTSSSFSSSCLFFSSCRFSYISHPLHLLFFIDAIERGKGITCNQRRGKHEGNRQKMTCSFTRFPWFITCHSQSDVSFLWSTCLSMPLITPQNDTQIE